MDKPIHRFHELFAQLGLPNDEHSIEQFLAMHAALPADVDLPDAPFWTAAQAAAKLHDVLSRYDRILIMATPPSVGAFRPSMAIFPWATDAPSVFACSNIVHRVT